MGWQVGEYVRAYVLGLVGGLSLTHLSEDEVRVDYPRPFLFVNHAI